MRRRLLLLASLSLLLPSVSCDEPTAPDGLRITAGDQRIRLENTGDEPIYTFALDMEMLALVDWMPCVSESCGRILPGATRTLTYQQLASAPGRLVRVYYWRELPSVGPMPQPGPVSSREFRLPPIRSASPWPP
jgi:hypothetical protein